MTRYDKIRLSEGSDRYDPFTLMGNSMIRGSYIETRKDYELSIK